MATLCALEGLVELGHVDFLAHSPRFSAPAAPLPFPAQWNVPVRAAKRPQFILQPGKGAGLELGPLQIPSAPSGKRMFPGSVMKNVWGQLR